MGVDTGGTFTDFVRSGDDGLYVDKRRSTPADPSDAILSGLEALLSPGSAADVVHGSTVATNAVLERRGARVAFVTNRGFEDLLSIGRQTRAELYNIQIPLPRPLVDAGLAFGVAGRLDASGTELEPVDLRELGQLSARLRRAHVEVVAVCLLHSYANPSHEREVAARLRDAGLVVCASHDVLPEYREFERGATTVLNAYVTPIMAAYLARLEEALGGVALGIMQSNGGAISAAAARAQAVRTVLSGPAAGVVGARVVARAAGFSRVVSFDMGGTSTDVSLIDDELASTNDSYVGDFPMRLPMLDIHTVGAGGGSIAYVDGGGALRVGPRSAGAKPGPACYGEGTALTVTDANLLLGRLDPEFFLGGRMSLDVDRARAAAVALARRLRLGPDELAEGVVRVANANMERAIRVVSIERGHDPRRFALLAFGGAGGMHACDLARALEMSTVIVPRHAGVLSALGMLMADVTRDFSAAVMQPADRLTHRAMSTYFRPLVSRAVAALASEGFARRHRAIERQVDVRYLGQSHEITVPWTDSFRAAFDAEHRRRYGDASDTRPVEVVAVRVRATGQTDKPALPRAARVRSRVARPAAVRSARFDGRSMRTGFHRWPDLSPGAHATGPAVITGGEATVVVPPGAAFRVDAHGNIVIAAGRRR